MTPPPLQIRANFAQNPSSKMCKIFLRGDPYYSLHISEEGGGPPPSRMCKIGLPDEVIYCSTIYPNSRDLGTAE